MSSKLQFSFLATALVAMVVAGDLGAIVEEDFFEASMIDDRAQGQLTASGARYERDSNVITHPYLPIGTRVQITHLENKQTTTAEIVDRPFPVFHSLGLSAAVAQRLGIPPCTPAEVSVTTQIDPDLPQTQDTPKPGRTIPVAYRPFSSSARNAVSAPETAASSAYRIQFGSFADPANAAGMQRILNGLGIPSAVSTAPSGKHFRVLSLSTYENAAQAQTVADLMIQRGLIREGIAVR